MLARPALSPSRTPEGVAAYRAANRAKMRAHQKVRDEIRHGRLTRPDGCEVCGAVGTTFSYSPDLDNPLEGLQFLCGKHYHAIRPRAEFKQPTRLELIRKLPTYDVLKQLVLPIAMGGENLTYAEVAKRYGCCEKVVAVTLKRRATARGEWPLPIRSADVLPSYEEVKHMVLAPPHGLGMTYKEVGAKYQVTRNVVEGFVRRRAIAAGEWPLEHADPGVKRAAQLRLSAPDRYPKALGIYLAIEHHCEDADLTRAEWAREHGFKPKYLHELGARLDRDPNARIRKDIAVKLLKALGEPVPRKLVTKKAVVMRKAA